MRVTDLIKPEISVDNLNETQKYHEAANCDLKPLNSIMEVQLNILRSFWVYQVVPVCLSVHVDRQEPLVEFRDDFSNYDEGNGAAENWAKVREGLYLQNGPVHHPLRKTVGDVLPDNLPVDRMTDWQQKYAEQYQ